MEARLWPTDTLLRRSRELRYPVRKPTLLKLVQAGFVDHAKRPGKGQGKGRAGLWTVASLRQVSAWCRFREAGLRDDRLAFAMWWETGALTPGVRDFLHRVLRLVEVMIAGVVFRGHRPQSAGEAKNIVRRYVKRTEPADLLPIVDLFGAHGPRTEYAVLAGALGLFEGDEPLGATIQNLAPMWTELSSLPPPQSIDSMMKTIKLHMKTLVVFILTLAPHFDLSKIQEAIDEATDDELSEARTYLRQAAAAALRLRGTRGYFRRLRKVLAAIANAFRRGTFRRHKMPRWARRFQDVYSWEGLWAFAVFVLLRVQQAIGEIHPNAPVSGLRSESR